jgi:hypothetical protein
MAPTATDPRLTLSYEESIRAWALQSSVLDELRNRAGVVLSAASVSSAFLGAKALEGEHHFSVLSIAATATFGVVVLLCVYIVWPAKDWVFVHDGKALIDTYVTDGVSLDEMTRDMTLDNAKYRVDNGTKIGHRFLGFRLACVGLGADVILWLIQLGTKGLT